MAISFVGYCRRYPLSSVQTSTSEGRALPAELIFLLREMLDNLSCRSKIPDNPSSPHIWGTHLYEHEPADACDSQPLIGESMDQQCLHPRVQIVSRDEDAE